MMDAAEKCLVRDLRRRIRGRPPPKPQGHHEHDHGLSEAEWEDSWEACRNLGDGALERYHDQRQARIAQVLADRRADEEAKRRWAERLERERRSALEMRWLAPGPPLVHRVTHVLVRWP